MEGAPCGYSMLAEGLEASVEGEQEAVLQAGLRSLRRRCASAR